VTEYDIPINIDDAPVGYGVLDDLRAAGYSANGVSASHTAVEAEAYPNKRSELWFITAERARLGEIDVSRLSDEWKDELGRQAKSAGYKLNGKGQRVVDPKDLLKERLGRSCDSIDAMNLAYYASFRSGPGACTTTTRQGPLAGAWR
jgi:hypothetical protein